MDKLGCYKINFGASLYQVLKFSLLLFLNTFTSHVYDFQVMLVVLSSLYDLSWILFIFMITLDSSSLFLFLSCSVVMGWDTSWHLQRSLQCINYIILEFNLSTIPLYSSPTMIHGTVSTGYIFPFTCTCTHILHCIHSPNHQITSHTGTALPPGQDLFPTLLRFCNKEKRLTEKHGIFASFRQRQLHREFPCDIPFIYVLYPQIVNLL
jgi:hypothetical protein